MSWGKCDECHLMSTEDPFPHADDCPRRVVGAVEAAARTAWITFLNSQIDGGTTHEMVELTRTTLEALPEAERAAHETWRNTVVSSMEKMLAGFRPKLAVTDESPVPSSPDPAVSFGRNHGIEVPPSPRPTVAELGYFESIGRIIGILPKAQRIRVLVASLVTYAFEADLPPVELSMMVTRAARRYFARLNLLSSSAPYDGHGLIGYAFPPEKP